MQPGRNSTGTKDPHLWIDELYVLDTFIFFLQIESFQKTRFNLSNVSNRYNNTQTRFVPRAVFSTLMNVK